VLRRWPRHRHADPAALTRGAGRPEGAGRPGRPGFIRLEKPGALILPAAASAQENFPEPDLRPLHQYRADGTFRDAVTADFHGKGDFGQDIAVQADGELVGGGFTANGVDTEYALMRVNP
jgi:hypothetical protein